MTGRAAVYNRFWHSRGGGERHSGKLAEVLAAGGWQVDLLGHEAFSREDLGAHLGLDLSRCAVRVLPYRGDALVEEVSGEYDLFVNASHLSRARARARRNVYLCYFPTPVDFDWPPWRRTLLRAVAPRVARGLPWRPGWGPGWFPPEGGPRRSWAWTSGDAAIPLPHTARRLRLDVARPGGAPTTLAVLADGGTELATLPVTGTFATHEVDVSAAGARVRLVSDTFSPGPEDRRELGVAVSRLRLDGGGRSLRSRLALHQPWLLLDATDVSFLDSYDRVVANSEFTRGWVRRLWGRDADVLFPPIRVDGLAPETERAPTIVSVGRFFRPGTGHAKRQLEMVTAFGSLHRAGLLPGWTLHLAGGVEPAHRGYLGEVASAAAGLPVEIHPNAPRALVERLLGSGSVFWSATGLGESEDAAPWNQEHFGMTTVEAMAAGCVPVVIDRAGQREIVRDNVDGFRWSTPDEWAERTVRVATDEAMRARLAASAVERARDFSEEAFAARWREIAAGLGS
ncbi:MAG TPA: glycosyltransferase [Frankiaceae bacterium]|nr:glycosyltransferase [Frankiaceae bacterium]